MLHKEFSTLGDCLKAIDYMSSSPDELELNFITDDGKPVKETFKENQYRYEVNIHQPPIGDNS